MSLESLLSRASVSSFFGQRALAFFPFHDRFSSSHGRRCDFALLSRRRRPPPSFVGRLPPPAPNAVELLSLLLLLRRPPPSLPTFSLATVDRRLLPLNTVDPRLFLLPTPLASFFAAGPLLLTLLFLLFSTFDHRDLLPCFLLSSTVHASPHLGSVDPPLRWPFTVAGTLGFTSPVPSSSRCHLPSLFSPDAATIHAAAPSFSSSLCFSPPAPPPFLYPPPPSPPFLPAGDSNPVADRPQ